MWSNVAGEDKEEEEEEEGKGERETVEGQHWLTKKKTLSLQFISRPPGER